MAEVGLIGGAVLGAVANQLLDELLLLLRRWKSRDANLRNLDKLLQRLQPFVRELDSFTRNCSEKDPAHNWLDQLQQELKNATDLLNATRKSSNAILSRFFRSRRLVQLNESITNLVMEAALAQWASGLSTRSVVKDDLAHVATDVADLRASGERQERLLVEIGQVVTSQPSSFSMRDKMCTLNQLRTDFCSIGILNDESPSGGPPPKQPFRTRSSSEPQIYVENHVADRVISHLLAGGRSWRKWVGLWAMGGAGKTFAARRVFDDPRIEETFAGGRFWVTVSKDKPAKELDPEKARCEIKTQLKNRGRVLLVLDDVWERDILSYLDVISEGNILVTTRDEENLRSVGRFAEIVRIPPLSEERSWELFCWHAFHAHEEKVSAEIETVAREVAKECKGLPLALEVIGSAMAGKLLFDWEKTHLGKSLRREWQIVLEQLRSASAQGSTNVYNALYHRLQLSVDNLRDVDPRLPDCFFYFAAFPEDYDVDIEGLLNMWIAEGMVKGNPGSSISCEIEAKFLLGLLIASSMIQLSEGGAPGRPRCKIHDVMRDVARLNLKNNFGKNPKWWKGGATIDTHRKIEASELLCLYEPGLNLPEFPGEWNTRSTQFSAERLSLCHNSVRHLPDALNAPGLRVLMLSYNSNLQVLHPRFFRFFSHLRVLDLSHTGIVRVDGTILQQLRSLVLLDLRGCFYLEEVSDKIDSLPNLETILLCYCANLKTLPLVKNLTKLETFSMDIPCQIPVAQWRERMPFFQMRHMKRLFIGSRDVGLFGIGDPIDLRNIPFLAGSKALEELWLRRMTSFPLGMTEFSHLKILALSAFAEVDTLPAFDELPALERLVICDFPQLRALPASFGQEGAFPSLRAIHLYGLPKVEKLFTFHPGSMQALESLEIEHLPLKELPKFLTIYSSVKRLCIRRSVNSANTAPGIRGEDLESMFSEPNCFPDLESLEIECIGELPTAASFSKLGSLVCDIPRDRCPPSMLELEREGKLRIVEKNVSDHYRRQEEHQT